MKIASMRISVNAFDRNLDSLFYSKRNLANQHAFIAFSGFGKKKFLRLVEHRLLLSYSS